MNSQIEPVSGASPQSSHSGAGTTAEIEYLGRLGKVDAQRREDGEVYPNGRIIDGLPHCLNPSRAFRLLP
jgi:hypothetical protein